jgi:hypothetical protein
MIVEVLDLKIGYFGVTSVLLLALMVPVCFGQVQDASTANGSQPANDTANASNTTGADIGTHTSENSSASVQGIWKISLGETDIIAAINQSGESIWGMAKFEGDNPWNGAVAGSLSGNAISVSLAAVEAETLDSTYMSGTVEGDSMKGYFIRSDSSGIATRGEFTAMLISPDTSGYTPAVIQTVSTSSAETSQKIVEQNNATSAEPAVPGAKSKFKDVTELARGIDPNILPRMAAL